jgi:hypothetical protein
MSKKHFIELADCLKALKVEAPVTAIDHGMAEMWSVVVHSMADFCQSQNSRFDRARWMAYIAGECGPNGGKA